ncbi:BTAD domain-containing putative transcriptional regulator [Luedemannella flava]
MLIGWPAFALSTYRWLPAPAGWYRHLLTDGLSEPRTVLQTATGIGWLLWIYLVCELAGAARQATRPRTPLRRWRPPARRHYTATAIASGAVLLTDTLLQTGSAAATPPTATTASPQHHHDSAAAISRPVKPAAHTVAGRARRGAYSSVPVWAEHASGIHHVVKGDNLWNIARDKLGNPQRWREIYVLNRGKPQNNGYALHDPDEIHIGWVLILPERRPAGSGASRAEHGDQAPARPQPSAPPESGATTPSTPTLPTAPPSTPPASTAPSSTPTTSTDVTTSPHPGAPTGQGTQHSRSPNGVALPSQGWVSLGLATAIAAIAVLLRLQRRRRARLGLPVPLHTGPTAAPVPDSLRPADAAGNRVLTVRSDGPLPGLVPEPPSVPAPIGVDQHGDEISLFEVPGRAVVLDGDGAPAAARAIAAAVLTTGVADHSLTRPVLVTTAELLARLLPDGASAHGLDPHHDTFDGERLIVVADGANAVTHLETEMIHRRRLLDDMGVDSADELNTHTDHAEHLAPYVLLIPAEQHHTARILAVASHRQALDLHPVILGALPDTPDVTHLHIAVGGDVTLANGTDEAAGKGRLAVLAAHDLAAVLAMVAAVAPRPETGNEPANTPAAETSASAYEVDLTDIPTRSSGTATPPPARLSVLGPPALATTEAPITSGVRRGSLAVLAVLAAHPKGRTFEELAADLHPDADTETGINRVRTDLNAVRSLLRDATGIEGRGKFIVHDSSAGRYRIDPELIEVDLWRMLSALDRANKAGNDETCLAALHEAVACYRGDFAEGHDRAWVIDYATTYRHQILSAYARIAEILEIDHPDQAIAALDTATERDPVNEELYQRVMRIHGRLGRPDAVRRTLRLLENRLAELCEAEPSEATRRIAARQMTPTLTGQR